MKVSDEKIDAVLSQNQDDLCPGLQELNYWLAHEVKRLREIEKRIHVFSMKKVTDRHLPTRYLEDVINFGKHDLKHRLIDQITDLSSFFKYTKTEEQDMITQIMSVSVLKQPTEQGSVHGTSDQVARRPEGRDW